MKSIGSLLREEVHRVALYLSSARPSQEEIFMTFSWSKLYQEFQRRCPQLLHILSLALPPQKRTKVHPCLCIIIAILAKAKNKNAHLVQILLSLVLLYGHTSSQVSMHAYIQLTILQSLCLCMHNRSHALTIIFSSCYYRHMYDSSH